MAENTVTIPVEEYADLVACRTKVHTACALIANEHQRDIELMGKKGTTINSKIIELALGYIVVEACFVVALFIFLEGFVNEYETVY